MYERSFIPMSYSIADLRTLSKLEPIAELADGVILKVKQDWRFNVLHSGNHLAYLKEPCTLKETEPLFFLHITPVDRKNLPEHRQAYNFDALVFRFETHGNIDGDKCVAIVDLPDYDIISIKTGQQAPAERGKWIWTAEFPLTR